MKKRNFRLLDYYIIWYENDEMHQAYATTLTNAKQIASEHKYYQIFKNVTQQIEDDKNAERIMEGR